MGRQGGGVQGRRASMRGVAVWAERVGFFWERG